jgi:hypothetical protein
MLQHGERSKGAQRALGLAPPDRHELDDELASNRRIVMNARADRYPRTVPAVDPHGATDVRLRSDEPQADQRQYADQDGEQEAI